MSSSKVTNYILLKFYNKDTTKSTQKNTQNLLLKKKIVFQKKHLQKGNSCDIIYRLIMVSKKYHTFCLLRAGGTYSVLRSGYGKMEEKPQEEKTCQ